MIKKTGDLLKSEIVDSSRDNTSCFHEPSSETVGATEDLRDLRKTMTGQKESEPLKALLYSIQNI
jgi:hypothetical protein